MSGHPCSKVPMTRFVDEAEKEASEVLHSLLSVERIENPSNLENIQHQKVVVLTSPSEVQWKHNAFDQEYQQYDKTVGWEHTLSVDVETSTHDDEPLKMEDTPTQTYRSEETVQNKIPVNKNSNKGAVKRTGLKWKKKVVKSTYKGTTISESTVEENSGSDDVNDVRQRFRLGCECHDISCFKGLNPDNVYRHRLNIAELTKEEHDMYLMGVTMACMSDPGMTVKQRERRRLRAQYVYQGRRVCLSAFLYLENCTLYQLKRIRKHVMTHGVTPRVHGNHGKKPHNVFSLETYTRATDFLKNYIGFHTSSNGNCKNTVVFPSEVSRKTIHNEYQMYMRKIAPDEKTMGYSTFRHFMKEQFPHVKFCKAELGSVNVNNCTSSTSKQQQQQQPSNTHRSTNTEPVVSSAPAPVQGVAVPLTLLQDQDKAEVAAHTTYIVTPVAQLVPAHTITIPYANYAFASIS